jgi:predicted TIM-barrel fold metal-dependent hydrolase
MKRTTVTMKRTIVTKSFPVFDCDAHVVENPAIWDYLTTREKAAVEGWFSLDGDMITINRRWRQPGPWAVRGRPSGLMISGPGVNKKIIRKLYEMDLDDEQLDYVVQRGARDPHVRVADMDLQGIDQVVVIPLMMMSAFLFVQDVEATAAFARAYNNWANDWCSAYPNRLFPAAVLPVQDPERTAAEIRRVSELGFKVAMIRPVDVDDRYPNQPQFDPVWRAFEETGLVVAMHQIAAANKHMNLSGHYFTPGEFLDRIIDHRQISVPSQTLSFVHEAMTWITNALLTGFFDRFPGVTRMAIMESNASWLPSLLEELDRAAVLYRRERRYKLSALPSEVFRQRMFIAFEGDETPVYQQGEYFEDLGIWSSDCYHHDGADAWSALSYMEPHGLSDDAKEKLMGGNARRMYGIEPQLFTTSSPTSYSRPDWYPKEEDVERELAGRL